MSITGATYSGVRVGDALESLEIGPWTSTHILRYCAATENWERQHTDFPYATEHDGLPNVMANGGWRKYLVSRLLKQWSGHAAWMWKLSVRYTGLHLPGDTFEVWGRVIGTCEHDGVGFVEIEAGIRNQRGEETSPAWAIVALPLRPGQVIGLPFSPPESYRPESPFRRPRVAADPKYVTEAVRAFVGHETEEVESVDRVSASELRRMAQAIPDLDRLYWDEAYAARTRFGGVVAPALFPIDAFRQPLDLPDRLTEELARDPDFQGGPPWDRRLIVDLPLETPKTSNMNGGQEFEVFDLARPGGRLRTRRTIVDIFETESARFGRAVYRIEDATYRNEAGALILRARIALVYR